MEYKDLMQVKLPYLLSLYAASWRQNGRLLREWSGEKIVEPTVETGAKEGAAGSQMSHNTVSVALRFPVSITAVIFQAGLMTSRTLRLPFVISSMKLRQHFKENSA